MDEDSSIKFIPKENKDCPECGKPRISFGWCKECETNSTKENFRYWTSENIEIDELIRHTQLSASQACEYLEWIPFERFDFVKYIGSGGFSSVYSAIWMEGPRRTWDDAAQEWTRTGPTKIALKRLDNSLNISSSYVTQVVFQVYMLPTKFFALTRNVNLKCASFAPFIILPLRTHRFLVYHTLRTSFPKRGLIP